MSASIQTRTVVLLLSTAWFALGQSQPPAEELLAQVAQRYRRAEAFYFDATQLISTRSAELQREQTLHLVTAQDKAGRWRVEMGDTANRTLAVFDGSVRWIYRPAAETYTKQQTGATSGEAGADSPLAAFKGSFISRYSGLADRIMSARLLGEQSLEVDGLSIWCQLIEADYAPPSGSAAAKLRRKFWIEHDRLVIRREESEARIGSPGTDEVVVRETVSFRVGRLDEPLREDLFSFSPPAGSRQVESSTGDSAPRVGIIAQPAPGFEGSDLEGNPLSLAELRGKVVLLNFWATWCVPCRIELPRLEALHRSWQGGGLVVLGVNSEARDIAAEFVEQHGYTFPTLADSQQRMSRAYGVRSIPTTVGIDKDGDIAFYLVGAQSESELDAALAKAGLSAAGQ